VIKNLTNPVLEAAYLYYYATEVGLQPGDNEQLVKQQLMSLIGDALIIANEAKFDVFNALTLMDNVPILQDLKVLSPYFDLQTLRSYYSLPVWSRGWLLEFLPLQLADCKLGWHEYRRLHACWKGCGCCNAIRTDYWLNKSTTEDILYKV
jgi:Myristoyl-CoA:protein N-myristoyltransferase, C-terminal domain